ncbi:MAG: hypothetical protein K2X01_02775 [Cyanobacteria bacterium]|nr:hypothetical protein [Cyanobacteriota bacterium]
MKITAHTHNQTHRQAKPLSGSLTLKSKALERTLTFGTLSQPPQGSPIQKPKQKPFYRRISGFIARVVITYTTLIGGGEVYNHVVGDGALPRFSAFMPYEKDTLLENTTAGLSPEALKKLSAEEKWQALQPTLKILNALSPDIADWVKTQHRQGNLSYGPPTLTLNGNSKDLILASFTMGSLKINTPFWQMPDGYKAATLVHEYRHSRQNWGKLLSVFGTKLLTADFAYPSRIEDDAFLYEQEAIRAMGLPVSSGVEWYLRQQNLNHLD